ncbi:hypothetical protein J437_LFUL005256 [Ladona fulva]|uniref:Uncharacterized protein n=1 Tax=Ladona fulva TaxID=123851 RepID=A0A8K0NYD9_LADFU|nr:hypothetical protein J437_LFUL005256 [Ladona fulva]
MNNLVEEKRSQRIAYGKVFLVRRKANRKGRNGECVDAGRLYAMKVLKKASIVQKKKTTEHTRTERQVLEAGLRSGNALCVFSAPLVVVAQWASQRNARGGEISKAAEMQ